MIFFNYQTSLHQFYTESFHHFFAVFSYMPVDEVIELIFGLDKVILSLISICGLLLVISYKLHCVPLWVFISRYDVKSC